ncbi:MAG TPA: hypothetical protein VJR29_03505 [bacterium]|nr:hypothetical protein [bacterium]
MRRLLSAGFLALALSLSSPLFAQNTPEAAYAQWVEVSKAGDVDGLLALSTAEKVKEYHRDVKTPEQKAEVQKLMKALAPKSYTVKSSEISKDGKKATLKIDAIALDFFSMGDPKAKPGPEKMKVTLVKEGGQWKVDQQSSGSFAEEEEAPGTPLAYGKSVALPDGSFKVLKGKTSFAGAKVNGKPYAVDVIFNFPETGSTLFMFFHDSPNLADNYVKVGDEKVAPIAFAEDFPPVFSDDKGGREVTVMEKSYSYSKNRNFKGTGGYSMLFDLPKDAKEAPVLHLKFKYDDKDHVYEVR